MKSWNLTFWDKNLLQDIALSEEIRNLPDNAHHCWLSVWHVGGYGTTSAYSAPGYGSAGAYGAGYGAPAAGGYGGGASAYGGGAYGGYGSAGY